MPVQGADGTARMIGISSAAVVTGKALSGLWLVAVRLDFRVGSRLPPAGLAGRRRRRGHRHVRPAWAPCARLSPKAVLGVRSKAVARPVVSMALT